VHWRDASTLVSASPNWTRRLEMFYSMSPRTVKHKSACQNISKNLKRLPCVDKDENGRRPFGQIASFLWKIPRSGNSNFDTAQGFISIYSWVFLDKK
jgi:hypothetical protein